VCLCINRRCLIISGIGGFGETGSIAGSVVLHICFHAVIRLTGADVLVEEVRFGAGVQGGFVILVAIVVRGAVIRIDGIHELLVGKLATIATRLGRGRLAKHADLLPDIVVVSSIAGFGNPFAIRAHGICATNGVRCLDFSFRRTGNGNTAQGNTGHTAAHCGRVVSTLAGGRVISLRIKL